MAFLKVHPRYQRFLQKQGLTTPAAFLELPAVILCGHPDRNVARVRLGSGSAAIAAFLKREHGVPWKERLRNAMAGFGFVSKSSREAAVLRSLQEAGVACPDWMAVGEDSQGRAFLLLREVSDTVDLRCFLSKHRHAAAHERRRIARKLGETLAHFHNAGFNHPDLYSKHILVRPTDRRMYILDWQRSRRRGTIPWRRRCRDLAALEATLVEDLATVHERLLCLRAYLRTSQTRGGKPKPGLRRTAFTIDGLAARLRSQRRIRELRRIPAPERMQGLIWQDGEALCLTPEFQAELAGHIPDWLQLANFPRQSGSWEARTWEALSESRSVLLIRRRQRRSFGRLWCLLRRRRPTSPEVLLAGQILRLERYGIRTFRLLAFGQRCTGRSAIDSFLLIEPPAQAIELGQWLVRQAKTGVQARACIRALARTLRRLHDLHYYLAGQPGFAVTPTRPGEVGAIVLASIDRLQSRRRASNQQAWEDWLALQRMLAASGYGRTDALRLLLSYLGLRKLNALAKRWARVLLPRQDCATEAGTAEEASRVGWLRLRTADRGTVHS